MFAFNERAEQGFDEYTGIFDSFIESYRQNLEELQELSLQVINILDSGQFMSSNNAFITSSNSGQVSSSSNGIAYDADVNYLQQALDLANSGDLDGAMDALDRRNQKVEDQNGNDRGISSAEAYNKVMQTYNSSLKGYSEGIENGPITETGPIMVHGTNESPEYVLNSDQAYNLLRNAATGETTEIRGQKESQSYTTGNALTGQVTNTIQGINKIISQISVLINQLSLTNSKLGETTIVYETLVDTLNKLYELKNLELENEEVRFDQTFEQIESIIENTEQLLTTILTIKENTNSIPSILENQETFKDLSQELLDNVKIGVEDLEKLIDYLGNGFKGNVNLTTGQFTGNLNGGYGSSSSNSSSSNGNFNSGGHWTDAEMNEGFIDSGKTTTSINGNYGGYGSRNEFDNAIHEAFDKAQSTGEKVSIGNSGISIDPSKIKSYSEGIENGPISYTGLAMLHGSTDSPEYVLNSDQAYNLLRNMGTLKTIDFESKENQSEGTNYIVEGDIILQDVNNPAEFWKKVTNTMETRWNVTKNKKY